MKKGIKVSNFKRQCLFNCLALNINFVIVFVNNFQVNIDFFIVNVSDIREINILVLISCYWSDHSFLLDNLLLVGFGNFLIGNDYDVSFWLNKLTVLFRIPIGDCLTEYKVCICSGFDQLSKSIRFIACFSWVYNFTVKVK